jgi:energy-coupling factor transporter ATP-binding protein EcfA2
MGWPKTKQAHYSRSLRRSRFRQHKKNLALFGRLIVMSPHEKSNPFPGLRFFGFDDTTLFFGREGQSDTLLRKLGDTRFLAVVGASGSGKSSLICAGLLPALYSGLMTGTGSQWRVALFRPGNDPIGNLARAVNSAGQLPSEAGDNAEIQSMFTEVTLRRSSLGLIECADRLATNRNQNLLVIVDQFEELFRFRGARSGTGDQAAAFVKLLIEAAAQDAFPVYVVLTMRSDFLGDCAQFHELPEAINRGQYLIPRMSRDDRTMAITGPIAVGGAQITPRLVNRLLNDMGESLDQLPIMQHALMRTWEHWTQQESEKPLDLANYEAIGGMNNALSLHGDEAYNELADERSRMLAEKVFKALTEMANSYVYRRPAQLREVCDIVGGSQEEVSRVIDIFRREGRSFLTPPVSVPLTEETIIDISHESLVRNWDRLRAWVNEEARAARVYRRLAEAAVLHGAGQEALMSDPSLQIALDWIQDQQPNRAWANRYHREFDTAMRFLEASRENRDMQIAERRLQLEAERERERRFLNYQVLTAKRLRLLVFALALLLLIALATAAYGIKARSVAVKALATARENEKQSIEAREHADQLKQEAERATIEAQNSRDQLARLVAEVSDKKRNSKRR